MYKHYLIALQINSISNELQEEIKIRYYNKSFIGNRNLNTVSEKELLVQVGLPKLSVIQ